LFIFIFASWEFVHNLYMVDRILEGILIKLFILFTAGINSFHTYHAVTDPAIEVAVNRRYNKRRISDKEDRRANDESIRI